MLIVYKEKVNLKQIISLIVCVFGILFFIEGLEFSKMTGILMALASAVTYSIYLVNIEKFKLSKMDNIKLSFYMALSVVISLLFLNIFTKELIISLSINTYLVMAIISVLAQFFAIVLLKEGIEHLGSKTVSLLSMIEPISSVIFGYIFLNEIVTINKIIGSCIIIIGLIILVFGESIYNNLINILRNSKRHKLVRK